MTKLVGIDPWIDTILGRLNGAVPPMVRTEVTNAIREFFVESTVWRADLYISLVSGQSTYDLQGLVAGGTPVFVHEAYYDDRALRPMADLPSNRNDTGTPAQYWSPEPGLLRLSPIPDKTENRKLRIVLSLQPSGCEVPCYVRDQFFGGILDGAMSRMYFHSKRPYSNPALGQKHAISFQRQVARARSIRGTRFTPAPHSFRYPRGWSPRI